MDTKLPKRSLFPALMLISLSPLLAAGEASASQAVSAVRSVRVSYRDLNLATPEGAGTLYRRIRGAARTVCGDAGRSLLEQGLWTSCYNGAIARAVATVAPK
ncbi:MAG: UrcA family protein [Gammaproteobacteria bacterium]|nr:UrcA family protein [Gammaproteobacteria bacterium]